MRKRTQVSNPEDYEIDIRQIFKPAEVTGYHQDVERRQLEFEVEEGYGQRTFEMLEKLSKLLMTTKINLNRSYVADQGCDSCGHGFSIRLPISCSEVVFYHCVFIVDRQRCMQHATNRTGRFCDAHAPLRCACGRQASMSIKMSGPSDIDEDKCMTCGANDG